MTNAIELTGKNVLVTGGNRGIGAALVRTFAACGANVLINFLQDNDSAEKLRDQIIREFNVSAHIFQCDVSDSEAVARMFRFADDALGSIQVLVNNAGCETVEHAVKLEEKDWDRIMNVNLKGAFLCSQMAATRMMEANAGVIINISSIHDKIPRKGLIHYCTAKAGLNMMAKCLALELAEYNIRVVTVSPGAIETDMNKLEIERFGKEKFHGWIPLGKIGNTEDVSWICAFLASDKGSYITATEIYVDGGYKESTIQYDPRP